jgi:hypothetical protein
MGSAADRIVSPEEGPAKADNKAETETVQYILMQISVDAIVMRVNLAHEKVYSLLLNPTWFY